MKTLEKMPVWAKKGKTVIVKKINQINRVLVVNAMELESSENSRYNITFEIDVGHNVLSLCVLDCNTDRLVEKEEIWLLHDIFKGDLTLQENITEVQQNIEVTQDRLDKMYQITQKYIKLNNK